MQQSKSPIPQYDPTASRIAKVAGVAKGNPDEFYVLSYRYYNSKECEIGYLARNRGKETLEVLKKIGMSSQDTIDESGIDRFPVGNSGAYASLFNGLPDEFDVLYEHKIQGDSRLFYHRVGNRFYIICIKNNHIETKKHRR